MKHTKTLNLPEELITPLKTQISNINAGSTAEQLTSYIKEHNPEKLAYVETLFEGISYVAIEVIKIFKKSNDQTQILAWK